MQSTEDSAGLCPTHAKHVFLSPGSGSLMLLWSCFAMFAHQESWVLGDYA